MKKLLSTCLIAGALFSAPAHAMLIDIYASAGVGFGNQRANDEWHGAASMSGAIGADIPFVRAELEYNHLNISGGYNDNSIQTAMVNAYIKPLVLPIAKPYFGVGYGRMLHESENVYQAMLGVQIDIPLTDLYVDVEGRGIFSNDAIGGDDLYQYELRVKLRYNF